MGLRRWVKMHYRFFYRHSKLDAQGLIKQHSPLSLNLMLMADKITIMTDKRFLLPFILIEGLVAATMVYEHNWWAASGWGLYMLSNISLLLRVNKEEEGK